MIIKAKKHFNSIIMKTTVAFVALVAVCCITAYSRNLFAEAGAQILLPNIAVPTNFRSIFSVKPLNMMVK